LTSLEKRIYNTWLATVRSKNGKPFKLRQKWDDFEAKPEYGHVRKLAKLFMKFDNINIDEFFTAPFKVYPEPYEYDIRFYNTMKALTCYRIYKKKSNSMTTKEFMDSLKTKK